MTLKDRVLKLFSRRSSPGAVPTLGGATFNWPYFSSNPTAEACIRKISATLAPLKIDLYTHRKGGGRAPMWGHPLSVALKNPDPSTTSIQFFAALIDDLMRGNAYVRVQRIAGQIMLSRLASDDVRLSVDQGRKVYTYGGQVFTDRDVLHIPYPFHLTRISSGYDLYKGIGPEDQYSDLIALDNELTAYIKMYFGNSPGKRLSITMGDTYKGKTPDQAYALLMPQIQKFVLGAANSGRPLIAPHDTTLSPLDGTQNLYDDIKSLKEMVEREIALGFGVPYSLLSEQNKYDSLDANQIQFLSDTIQPLGTHIEQSFNRLLAPQESALFCQYDYSEMLKSDPTETADYLGKLVQHGLYTINEARDVLGLDAVEAGDTPLVMANQWPLTKDTAAAFFAKQSLAASHSKAGDDKQ